MTTSPQPNRPAPLLLTPVAITDEQRLLALALTYPSMTDVVLDPEQLRATDFYADGHSLIYTAMRAVRKIDDPKWPVNPVTVAMELRKRGKPEEAKYVVDVLPDTLLRQYDSTEVVAWIKALQARRAAAEKQAAQELAREAVESGDPAQIKQALELMKPAEPTYLTLQEHAQRTLMHADQLSTLPPTRWLIPGVIPTNKIMLGFGPAGIGKSFTFTDIALTVGQFANVVYVAAEDAEDYALRVDAWKQHHGLSAAGLYFWTEPLRLADADEIDTFIAQITPLHPALVIIDPLADCMRGLNERDEEGMGAAVTALNRIRRATQAGVLVIHHTGWSEDHERGSSVLRAASRMVIRVARDQDDLVTVSCEKINGGKKFEKRYFRHIPVGDSIVPVPASKIAKTTNITERQLDVLEYMAMRINDKGVRHTDIVNHFNYAKSTVTDMLDKFYTLKLIDRRTKGASDIYSINDEGRDLVHERVAGRSKAATPTNETTIYDRLNWHVDTSEISEEARSAYAPQGEAPPVYTAVEGYGDLPEAPNGSELAPNYPKNNEAFCSDSSEASSVAVTSADAGSSDVFGSCSAGSEEVGFSSFGSPPLYKGGTEQPNERTNEQGEENQEKDEDLFPDVANVSELRAARYRWFSVDNPAGGKLWHIYTPTNTELSETYPDKDEAIDAAWEHYRGRI